MRDRLVYLYMYVKQVYGEFPQELKNFSSPEKRAEFVLKIIEADLTSIPNYKYKLYGLDRDGLIPFLTAGITNFTFISDYNV